MLESPSKMLPLNIVNSLDALSWYWVLEIWRYYWRDRDIFIFPKLRYYWGYKNS